MQELNDRIQAFAAEHSLECVDGLYAGRYEDMYITLRAEEETALRVMVCLNLPRGGRRKALGEALAEKLARYGAKPVETAFANALAFRFYGNDPLDDMRRFLAEADPLLRPYGREMGVLCARCRREFEEGEAYTLSTIDGELVPVCAECAETGRAKRGENRSTIRRKRVRRGAVGGLLGLLAAAAAWALMEYLGISSFFLPAALIPLLVNLIYEKMGGLRDRYQVWMVSLCSAGGIVLGGVLFFVVSTLYVQSEGLAELLPMYGEPLKTVLLSPVFYARFLPSAVIAALAAALFLRNRYR